MKKIKRINRAWQIPGQRPVIEGAPLIPNLAPASRYAARLDSYIERMTQETAQEITKLFNGETAEAFFAMDASISSQARILTNTLIKKYDAIFNNMAAPVAGAWVDDVDKSANVSANNSLREISGGFTIPQSSITPVTKEIINAATVENVALIKSIPAQYLNGVQQAVMRSITSGNGLQDLVPYLAKHKQITLRRARLIARDQTRKTYSALTRERMKGANVGKYKWRHTGGADHPRKDHIELSGQIFSWDNPPVADKKTKERAHPGMMINCGCHAIPVLWRAAPKALLG